MRYIVGENCAGYLPVSEPVIFSEEDGREAAVEYFLNTLDELYAPHPRPTKETVTRELERNDGYSVRFTTPEGRDVEVWVDKED